MPKPERQKERNLTTRVDYPSIKSGEKLTSDVNPPSNRIWKGRQVTVSEGHRKGRDGRYHEGGRFFTSRAHAEINCRGISMDNGKKGSERRKYSGPIHVSVPDTDVTPGLLAPDQDSSYLDPVGAEAISVVDPTNPNAQTGVALGEIVKDRFLPIPAIQAWRRRTETAKAAGSEYLNAQFGWLPLVSDMKNTAQSVKDGNTIIENYDAASGTLVHREFAFPDSVSISETVLDSASRCRYAANANIPSFNDTPVPLTVQTVTTVRRWFSGSFTYYAGGKDNIAKCLGIGSEADKLFGLSLTPDLVWELTPWSWAIDWFSNAGNVISNATSFGLAGLVMKYGYIMEETTMRKTYSMPDTGLIVKGRPPDCYITSTVKRRHEANPFGFGLSWEDLSPTQLAITAALGITRLR